MRILIVDSDTTNPTLGTTQLLSLRSVFFRPMLSKNLKEDK